MPRELHDALKKAADQAARRGTLKKRPTDSLEEAKDRFVYGTMKRMKKEHKTK